MFDSVYLESFAAALQSRPDVLERFEPGLSGQEVDAIQQRFRFIFPPDLRMMLQFSLPAGKAFPNWRSDSNEQLLSRLNWPLEGALFDVENNGIWPAAWGPRPDRESQRSEIALKVFAGAPRLIPIFAHRYIPDEPFAAGNPVFSVYQTDIIHRGNDLAGFFHQEFKVPLPDWAAGEPKEIRFWNDALRWRD